MNIFILDTDPTRAAHMQCDKHVVKMVLETGQMLSTVQRQLGNDDDQLYRSTHQHHPCTRWAAETRGNYYWLWQHFRALADEFKYRYGNTHLTWTKLRTVTDFVPPNMSDSIDMTPFALAMPDEYKTDCAVQSYRNYYRNAKSAILAYTKRQSPDWLTEQSQPNG